MCRLSLHAAKRPTPGDLAVKRALGRASGKTFMCSEKIGSHILNNEVLCLYKVIQKACLHISIDRCKIIKVETCLLLVMFMCFIQPVLAQTELEQARSDFNYGRRAIQACAPLRADFRQFTHCTTHAIWLPNGKLLSAVSRYIIMGGNYQALIMGNEVALLDVMNLDDNVKVMMKGDYGIFCRIFEISCPDLMEARRRVIGSMSVANRDRLHLLPR